MNSDQYEKHVAEYRARTRDDFVQWVEDHAASIAEIRPSEVLAASGFDERRFAPAGGLVPEDWPALKPCCGPEEKERTHLNRDDLLAAILQNALYKAGHSVAVANLAVEELVHQSSGEQFWIAVEQSGFAEQLADLTKRATEFAASPQTLAVMQLYRPRWDGRSLSFGGKLVREYDKAAENQSAILDAFQEANWAQSIDVPKTFLNGFGQERKSLRRTVEDLNDQNAIHFRKRGRKLFWELRRKA